MKPAANNHPRQQPSVEQAGGTSTPPQAARRRAVRKLFEPVAKPLDGSGAALAPLRQPRRTRPWIALLLFLLLPAAIVVAQEPPAPAPPSDGVPAPEEAAVPPRPIQLDDETLRAIVTNLAAVLTEEPAPPTNSPIQVVALAASQGPRPDAQRGQESNREDRYRNRDRSQTRSGDQRTPNQDSRSNGAPFPATQSSAGSPARTGSSQDYSAFRIITERNIFDPNRNARRANNAPRSRPKTVDSFALVGTMSYEKGTFAFFDGSKSEFRKALKESDQIAGFKVGSVGGDLVQLTAGEKKFELKVGMQLRREEDGDWEASSQAATYSSAPAPSVSAAPPPNLAPGAVPAVSAPSGGSAGADEVLRRLMQRREQE